MSNLQSSVSNKQAKGFSSFLNSKSGFTLVELMIVISIISILAVAGMVIYTNVLKNSRDSKRQADIKFIQTALEEYNSDQLSYPTTVNFPGTIVNNGRIYLISNPTEPLSTFPQYSYVAKPNGCFSPMCKSYCIYVKFEKLSLSGDVVCNPIPSGYSYGVTRP